MDDQTRLVQFESMRRKKGAQPTSNKKLFLVHMDLKKQCEREVKSYARDTHMATKEMTRQQKIMEEKAKVLHEKKLKLRVNEQTDTEEKPSNSSEPHKTNYLMKKDTQMYDPQKVK